MPLGQPSRRARSPSGRRSHAAGCVLGAIGRCRCGAACAPSGRRLPAARATLGRHSEQASRPEPTSAYDTALGVAQPSRALAEVPKLDPHRPISVETGQLVIEPSPPAAAPSHNSAGPSRFVGLHRPDLGRAEPILAGRGSNLIEYRRILVEPPNLRSEPPQFRSNPAQSI